MSFSKSKAFPLLGGSRGFTLVELIVVVTILALLSTIGFVSYSSYLSGVRDTNRISQLVAISDGLELYRTKKTLPIPDDNIEIRANGTVIGYQGYAGINVLETIDYSKTGKDPKDKIHFSYYLTQDKKHYQLLTYLEEEENLEVKDNLFQKTYADTDYTNRYPKVSGKKLGILTQSGTNIPVQEVVVLVSSGYLDIATTEESFVARLTDDNTISGTGANLTASLSNASCNRIKQMGSSRGDSEYTINPTGNKELKVYCDMSSDTFSFIKYFDTKDEIVAIHNFNNTLKDLSGNGLNGTMVGGAPDRFFNTNGGFNFDGVNKVNTSNDPKLILESGFSYSLWIYREQVSTEHWPVLYGNTTDPHNCYSVRSHNYGDNLNIEYSNAPGTRASSPTNTYSLNKWVHYIYTYDGINIKTYKDGKLLSTHLVTSFDPQNDCNYLTIGHNFIGIIDNTRTFNIPLDFDQVQALYLEGH